ncbi:MAG: acyl carrier protein [Rickettsiales bacterium]|jgi:acyl carrier protein|nr:acyl carrier protein [Rickettsiales bacterium]
MSNVEQRVKEIVAEHLGVEIGKISPDARFVEDLGADSLDQVELVMAFENEFDCEISDDDAQKILTLNDAVSYIQSQANAA